MKINDLKDKLVAVLGYGQEGKATTEYLIKHGVKPVLFDERSFEQFTASEQEYIKSLQINFVFGKQALMELVGYDIVFRTPGFSFEKINALNLKSEITSQTKFFFDNCPGKIIGITGTKGKGTTSSLIYQILQANKVTSYLTGNIGKIQPLELLDNLIPDDRIVYELSSFQLQDLKKSPKISVVLMTTSEHLDYHNSLESYINSKMAVTKYQEPDDFAIINLDYTFSNKIGQSGSAKKIFFSRKLELPGGIFVDNGFIVINNVLGINAKLPTSNFQLRGKHNLENVCAAIGASLAVGIKVTDISPVLENFKGLEHRLEFVREFNKVKYYNDSFSTTPETAIAAIRSFSEPLIIILGGSSKNSDFTKLGEEIVNSSNIKTVVIIGQEEQRILESLKGYSGTIFRGQKSFEEIFKVLDKNLAKGDVVLLSPACASFDMFKNYEDRGNKFKETVNSIK